MMPRMLRAYALAIVIGCSRGGTPPPPQPPPPAPVTVVVDAAPPADAAPLHRDLPRLAARSVELYKAIVGAFHAAGENCADAAVRLGELRASYGDVVTANATVIQEGRGKELEAALAPHDAELDAAAKDVMHAPTLAACAKDEAFIRAFDELVGGKP